MKITVIEAKDALAAVREDPTKILTIIKKKEERKYTGGAKFYRTSWKFGAQPATNGWFVIEDVPITAPILPPNDPRLNGRDNSRCNLQTRVSVAGDFGLFLKEFNPTFIETIAKYVADGTIAGKGKKIHSIVRDRLSDDNADNPGGPIEDPIISLDVDFKSHPKDFWVTDKAGKPKTEFFEYISGGDKDEHGREITPIVFKEATVFNPDTQQVEPVGEMNLHWFLKAPGAVIKRARLWFSSVCASQNWVSMPLCVSKVVIKCGDGTVVCSDGLSQQPVTVVPQVAQPLQPPADDEPIIQPATDDAITATLTSLGLGGQ